MPAEFSLGVQLLKVGTSAGLVSFLMWISFAGWGWLVARMFPRTCGMGPGLCGAIGMAFTIVAGGVLSLRGDVSVFCLRGYLIVGIVAFLVFVLLQRTELKYQFDAALGACKRDSLLLLLIVIAVGFLFMQFAAAGCQPFNSHDDYHGYLVQPVKMLQTGSLGLDPFNVRGMASLGGQSFLLAATLAVAPLTELHVLGMGVAWLVLLGLLLEHGLELKLAPRMVVGLLILVHFFKVPIVNLTSMITGLALFYSTIRVLGKDDREMSPWARSCMLGLMGAALFALKATHIPGFVAILAISCLYAEGITRGKRIMHVAAVAMIGAAMLTPWMLQSYWNYGTLLYPLLGKGNAHSLCADFMRPLTFSSLVAVINPTLVLTVGSPFFVAGLALVVCSRKELVSSRHGRAGVWSFIGAWARLSPQRCVQ